MNVTVITSNANGRRKLTVTVDNLLVIDSLTDTGNTFASVEVADFGKYAPIETEPSITVKELKRKLEKLRYGKSVLRLLGVSE